MTASWFRRDQDLSRITRDVASQAEAEAGVDNTKAITPLRMAQGIAAIAPGIGFDTLSNVLVVDPGFDSNTPGWGVTAFSTVFSANAVIVAAGGYDRYTIVVHGHEVAESETIEIQQYVTIIGISGANIIGYGEDGTFKVSSLSLTLSGSLSIMNDESNIALVLDSGNAILTGGVRIAGDVLMNDGVLKVINSTVGGDIELAASAGLVGLFIGNSRFNNLTAAGGQTGVLNMYDSGFLSIPTGVTVNPLDWSNFHGRSASTGSGVYATYREVVAFASLPAPAAGNAGAMAATSDGGTGSIPALMYSNGAAWVVAAE